MKIGFIGLGIMGEAMSRNIVKKHDDQVLVYDRNGERVKLLTADGAAAAESSSALVKQADLVISMVPASDDVRELYESLYEEFRQGQIILDMSTIHPQVSKELAEKFAGKGVLFLDAPVVKSRPAAETGTLGIYVGGAREAYETILPVLRYMGNNVIYMGGNGSGLVMKICHNTLVAQIQNGVNETMALAEQYGIAKADYVKAISYGGGQNFYLDGKAAAILEGNYQTAFSVKNMKKDLDILADMEAEQSVDLPGAGAARQVYGKAVKEGWSEQDFSATYEIVRRNLDE